MLATERAKSETRNKKQADINSSAKKGEKRGRYQTSAKETETDNSEKQTEDREEERNTEYVAENEQANQRSAVARIR